MNPAHRFLCVSSVMLAAACSAPDVPNPEDAGSTDTGSETGSDTGSDTATPGPDSTVPDTSVPDTSVPDTSIPDTSVADTSVPDTSVPDAGVPDADAGGDAAKVGDAGDSGPTCVINGTTYPNNTPTPSDVCASCVAATSTSLWTTMPCAAGLVCEDFGGPVCADPNWNAWPIPSSQGEATAGAPNMESYTDDGDGTVIDKITGLMWQQSPPTTRYAQAAASTYCAGLTLGAHADWRLPSLIELLSIVDLGQSNPAINATYFPSTPVDFESWTSQAWPSGAWCVNFKTGMPDGVDYPATFQLHVRCVR